MSSAIICEWTDRDGIEPASHYTPPATGKVAADDLLPLATEKVAARGLRGDRPALATGKVATTRPLPKARPDTVRLLIRAALLIEVFKTALAVPDEHWRLMTVLADLGDGETKDVELTWLAIGMALAGKDPDEWLDQREITRLKRNAIRAWNRFRKWQEAAGWALVLRSPGGLRANQANVPLDQREKVRNLFEFPFVHVLALAFDDAREHHLWRKGQRPEALRVSLIPLLPELRLEPGESVEWDRTEVAAPNTKGALATPARYEKGLENILKRHGKDPARQRLILREHGEWLDRMNAQYGTPQPPPQPPPTPQNRRAYNLDRTRGYTQSVHTPERCSSETTGVTGFEKVPIAPIILLNSGCTLLSSPVSVQGGNAPEACRVETFDVASAGQPPAPEALASEVAEATVSAETVASATHAEPVAQHPATAQEAAPSKLPPPSSRSKSSELTQHRAQPSKVTLESFARYACLPEDFLASVGIGMDADYWRRPYLCIPHFDVDGTLLGKKQRVHLELPDDPTQRRFCWVEGKAGLYGAEWIQEARQRPALIVCEGITDGVTFRYYGMPAVGLSSAATYRALGADHLVGIANVVIARDADRAGLSMAMNLSQHLMNDGYKGGIFCMSFTEAKDASDLHKCVEGDRTAFKAAFARGYASALNMREVDYSTGRLRP